MSQTYIDLEGWDLHSAARENRVDIARVFLTGGDIDPKHRLKDMVGSSVDMLDQDGDTPLHDAASHNSLEVASLLIEHGADIEARGKYGDTPLHNSARQNSLDVVELLISNNADVLARNMKRERPLHKSAENDHPEIAKLLLAQMPSDGRRKKNRPVDLTDESGNTVLHVAAEKDCIGVVALLLEAGANIEAENNEEETPLHRAAWRDSYEVAKVLLRNHADDEAIGQFGNTPLIMAACTDSTRVAGLLIEQGANLEVKSNQGDTALSMAAWNNSLDVARLLIEKRAELEAKNKNGETPLHMAARKNSTEVATLLIENGADTDEIDLSWMSNSLLENTVVLEPISNKPNTEEVNSETELEANIEAKDNHGWNDLHWAACQNSTDLAITLIDRGVDIEAKNDEGSTALHIAAENNHLDFVSLLLDRRADIEAKNGDGWTALHITAENNYLDVASLLIEKAANIEAKVDDGWTVLGIANMNKSFDVITLLIEHGANIDGIELSWMTDSPSENTGVLEPISNTPNTEEVNSEADSHVCDHSKPSANDTAMNCHQFLSVTPPSSYESVEQVNSINWSNWLSGFDGRINRSGLIVRVLIFLMYFLMFLYGWPVLMENFDPVLISFINLLLALLWVGIGIPMCIGGLVRRFHDRNKSGWRVLLVMIPFLNLLFAFELFFLPGDRISNEFGAPPVGLRIGH